MFVQDSVQVMKQALECSDNITLQSKGANPLYDETVKSGGNKTWMMGEQLTYGLSW